VKIVKDSDLLGTDRDVDCPRGGFKSIRILVERDGMGFSLHKTVIPVGPPQRWHYKHHREACYCVEGSGVITNETTGERHRIEPGTTYVLDNHEAHTFKANEPTVLISVLNPPVVGDEVHQDDGSYRKSPTTAA
jgi:L-ectoine synthase